MALGRFLRWPLIPSQMGSKGQPNGETGFLNHRISENTKSRLLHHTAIGCVAVLCLLATLCLDVQISVRFRKAPQLQSKTKAADTRCKPHLPSQLTLIQSSAPDLGSRGRKLDRIIRERVSKGDIDSVVLGIIGPDGLVWSQGYGIAQKNDTNATEPPNDHSIYRIASVSKLYATLETFIQRDRGALKWDDPITLFFPNFTYIPSSWREHITREENGGNVRHNEPITLRQLASHMSGIGRDYPSANLDDWPHVPPPPFANLPSRRHTFTPEGTYPQKPEILQAIAETPLVAPQYSYPIYSNTGFSLLGWCISVADAAVTGKAITYAELIKRDILEPLGMNGSSFLISSQQAEHMAFPEIAVEADYDMTDAHNSAGGQMSSLSDIAKTVRAFLNPDQYPLLSKYSLREWVRPLHLFPDNLTRVGLAWEIQKFYDSHGRVQNYYSKSGNLRYYHSEISINFDLGFGVVVLMAGRFTDSSWFSKRAIETFQPTFEKQLEQTARKLYDGKWVGKTDEENNKITLVVVNGSLWVTECVVNGDDLLELYTGGTGLTLWSTGRLHEFRVAVGRGELNSDASMGCLPYWVSFDGFNSHGAPVDLVYFSGEGDDLILHFPSANVTLERNS